MFNVNTYFYLPKTKNHSTEKVDGQNNAYEWKNFIIKLR